MIFIQQKNEFHFLFPQIEILEHHLILLLYCVGFNGNRKGGWMVDCLPAFNINNVPTSFSKRIYENIVKLHIYMYKATAISFSKFN